MIAGTYLTRGRRLASLLDGAIDREVERRGEGTFRIDVIEDMGREAGIAAATVEEILAADIDCPPLDRLEGFSRVLRRVDVTLQALTDAGNADGCAYGEDDGARGLTPAQINATGGGREGVFRQASVRMIDVEARTVEVAFSSEEPVERVFGEEILDHGAGAMRTGRLESGAPLLINHDWDDQIGVVQSIEIGRDRRGRAIVRFGRGARADEIFRDVVDGIRRNASVGYMVHKVEVETRSGLADMVRVTDWEPFEISIVAVPADTTVGVGRSANQAIEVKDMTTHDKSRAAAPRQDTAPASAPDDDDRVAAVLALGRAYAADALAAQVLRAGGGAAEMQAELLRQMDRRGGRPLSDAGDGSIGMSARDVGRFSILRLARHLAEPSPDTARDAAFELEASHAFARRTGRTPQGAFVPPDVLMDAGFARRDLTAGTPSEGGALVGTQLLAESFIDALRARLAVLEAGALMLPGLVGNVAIPRLTGGASHEWLPEGGAVTDSQPAMDQVTMSPKTVASSIPITRRLMLQSTPEVENMVRSDLIARITRAIDAAALNGEASANAPEGLREKIVASAADWTTAGAPTFAETVALETAVAAANADDGSLAYVYGAALGGHLKTTPIEPGAAARIEAEGQVNGYPRIKSNQAAAGDVFFGNWSDLIIGLWSGIDIRADTATLAASDGLVLRAFQDVDVAVRHEPSFALGKNV